MHIMIRGGLSKRVLWLLRMVSTTIAWALVGCATSGTVQESSQAPGPARIEAIEVTPGGQATIVKIVNSKAAPYTTFKLMDPPRLVLDIQGVPEKGLRPLIEVNDRRIGQIQTKNSEDQPTATRVVVGLKGSSEYTIGAQDNIITLALTDAQRTEQPAPAPDAERPPGTQEAEKAKDSGGQPVEPRIFFKPRAETLNQVLGVDFTMLEHGRSRLIVTTAKKASYQVKREGEKDLVLSLNDTTIPPLLSRRLDSSHFEGAVDQVKPRFSASDNRLSFYISLREMVPFHVDQTPAGLHVDFGPTSIKPAEKTIVPLKIAEARDISLKQNASKTSMPSVAHQTIPGLENRKRYKGAPMTMDFVNAEVTNILRLIGEVSNLNIIWGPEVKGTASMRLKHVPWDQALDLVLANNDLAMRRQGNVIWVTTRPKLAQIEAEEKRKRQEAEAEVEAKKQRILEDQKKSQELAPLLTQYLPVDFAKAGDIKAHIEKIKSERGSVSVDDRTNMVIVRDTAPIIEESKQIVKRFDTPVKQIMIEARIVESSTDFSRDLGVRWNQIETVWKKNRHQDFTVTDPTEFTRSGDQLTGGTFSTNAPEGWTGNLGFTLAKLTHNALGTVALDATLALAETEGKAKIISAPRVLASNGEAAEIRRGDVVYRDIVTADQIEVRELPATLSLRVTPTVSFNNFVSMELEVTDDKVFTDLTGKTEKSIKTKLMVKSGDTVVIGGIFQEDKSENDAGIPWLRNVPLLGWLFKARTNTINKAELLIFLTPTVVQATTEGNMTSLPPASKGEAS
jgi:type IV pilus assembly protein PilQ